MDGGVELGWLVDPDNRSIYVYRRGDAEPEKITGVLVLRGEGPVTGSDLDLTAIRAGL
jgi:Uma2 family endonuclease